MSAAILGYPLDGAFNAQPARVGQTSTVSTEDAYGEGHVLRTITALRGHVRPGNSGGPLVDAQGRVVATVFAALTGTDAPGRLRGAQHGRAGAARQRARAPAARADGSLRLS